VKALAIIVAQPFVILSVYVAICLAVAACQSTYNTEPLPPMNVVAP
jgi:hypothetical protein